MSYSCDPLFVLEILVPWTAVHLEMLESKNWLSKQCLNLKYPLNLIFATSCWGVLSNGKKFFWERGVVSLSVPGWLGSDVAFISTQRLCAPHTVHWPHRQPTTCNGQYNHHYYFNLIFIYCCYYHAHSTTHPMGCQHGRWNLEFVQCVVTPSWSLREKRASLRILTGSPVATPSMSFVSGDGA